MLIDGCWYAVHVRSRFERTVARLLEEKGYEPFLPVRRSRRQWSDRVKELEQPLFPNYVFCRIMQTATSPVVTTLGVTRIVGAGGTPIPVDDREIDALRRMMAWHLDPQPWRHVVIGQSVQITSGPLAGVTGVLCRFGNGDRFVVTVALLQRSVFVEVSRACVRPELLGDGPDAARERACAAAMSFGAAS